MRHSPERIASFTARKAGQWVETIEVKELLREQKEEMMAKGESQRRFDKV